MTLSSPSLEIKWTAPDTTLKRRMSRLTGYGSSDLYDEEELPTLFYFLEQLSRHTLLAYSIFHENEPLFTFTPYHGQPCSPNLISPNKDRKCVLSRFAYIRPDQSQGWSLESPMTFGTIAIKKTAILNLIYSLSNPLTVNELIANSKLPKEVITEIWALLCEVGVLVESDASHPLAAWEFHDLLFHTHSRRRHSHVSGATFRFLNKEPPSLPIKSSSRKTLPLSRPHLKTLSKNDPAFISVMEGRKSIRKHDAKKPITTEQLGEFLYRTARVKEYVSSQHYEATKRPYPGGGACYELEVYPLIHQCQGLEKGLYRYLPNTHALEILEADEGLQKKLLEHASTATGKDSLPQIALIIAARFHRVMWKYEGMAYSVILKNVGALMQTFYLTATAMNLAGCSVGGGDSDLFAQAAGLDYYEETSVGEFILGTPESR